LSNILTLSLSRILINVMNYDCVGLIIVLVPV
jgi:hypothetical protein